MFDDNSLEVAFIYLRRVSMHTHRLVDCTQRRAELMTNTQNERTKVVNVSTVIVTIFEGMQRRTNVRVVIETRGRATPNL
jgi:hypothetical protein